MKMKMISAATMVTMLVMAGSAYAEPVFNGKLIGIISDDGKPGLRAELLLKGLPHNSDIYATGDHKGYAENYSYKLRLQSSFIKVSKHIGFGAAAQHVNGDNFVAHQEVGGLMRITGHPVEGIFAKADIRYFPKTDTADMYAFLDSAKVFTELLASYNVKTKQTMLRPVVDFKVWKSAFIGIEAKLMGEIDNLDLSYTGIRVGLAF